MDVFEAIWTTRAMRHLDADKDVSDEDLWKILEAASKGPGRGTGNKFVVVRDAQLQRAIGDLYRERWNVVGQRIRETGFIPRSGDWLGQHFGESPAIILAVAPSNAEASIYNQVQNLLLAARALGIGTTLTTANGPGYEEGLHELLSIPADQKIWAVIPLGCAVNAHKAGQRAVSAIS